MEGKRSRAVAGGRRAAGWGRACLPDRVRGDLRSKISPSLSVSLRLSLRDIRYAELAHYLKYSFLLSETGSIWASI